jgi:hypothetical protein
MGMGQNGRRGAARQSKVEGQTGFNRQDAENARVSDSFFSELGALGALTVY